jgi:hypothetical protein
VNLRWPVAVLLVVTIAACSTGDEDLQVGDCVDIVGVGGDRATERLVSVDCATLETEGLFRVVWIEEAADADPVTITQLATECAGPTLLPDADMLQEGDRTVVCFEPLG